MDAHDAQLRREECRSLTLGYLAQRPQLAFRAEAIERGLKREHAADFAHDEVAAALAFLLSSDLVSVAHDPLGATKSWQATARGVLAHERSGA